MDPIKVVVRGALGRVGREVVSAVSRESDLKLVGAVDLQAKEGTLELPDKTSIPLSPDADSILTTCQPNVLVDFTLPQAVMPAVRMVTKRKVNMVVGTTGISPDDLKEIDQLARANRVGVVVAPNFALGAVIMMHLAQIAAKYFDNSEIIELHHNQKADAPSGTAMMTARMMAAARGKPFQAPPQPKNPTSSRGEATENVTIHSVRLPGLMAHQEVIFGAAGQTLSIRHDTINRECYMPGVLLAIREVVKRQGLIYGLDTLLGL